MGTAAEFRPCAVVPTYDNPLTIAAVVRRLREHVSAVFVVNDGSGPEGRAACEALAAEGLATVIHQPRNRGKGAATREGFQRAMELGFTHALQVDADGQHDISRAPSFLAAAQHQPDALVLGYPEYDATAPRSRLVGRRFTALWVGLEVGGRERVKDAMIGFRVYPLRHALASGARAMRMNFDVEIVVRMAWMGLPLINLPVHVRYLPTSEGGVSHFRPVLDNLAFAWLHSRLCTIGSFRWCLRRLRLAP